MNHIQKRILIAGAVLVCLACLYVPWTFHFERGVQHDGGYGIIFNPPKHHSNRTQRATLDLPRVVAPVFVIAVLTGVGIFLAKDYVPRSQPAPSDAIQDLSGRDLSIRK